MESPPKSPLLEVTSEEMWAMRRAVGLDDATSINRDIDMVVHWFQKQQHLPRIQLHRGIVERVLVSRKGSVEQTKQKIDLMFSLKTLLPDLAAPRDIRHPDIQRQFKTGTFLVMPKLNDDHSRVSICRYTGDIEHFDLADTLKYVFMTMEYRMKYDYSPCDRHILDFQNISLAHFTKQSPIVMKNAEIYVLKGFSHRIFGLHFVNAPSIIGTIVSIFKAALSAKLGQRITVHPNHDDLHKYINKRVLPTEYGGEAGPMRQYAEDWKRELGKEEVRRFLVKQESLRSNEALRIGQKLTNDSLGIPGSFKQLNVD